MILCCLVSVIKYFWDKKYKRQFYTTSEELLVTVCDAWHSGKMWILSPLAPALFGRMRAEEDTAGTSTPMAPEYTIWYRESAKD